MMKIASNIFSCNIATIKISPKIKIMLSVKSTLAFVLNTKTLIVTALSVLATYLCLQYKITAKFPDLLIGMAIVFPVVFSIGSAFSRREFALQRLSDFKGHLFALYYAAKDWPAGKEPGSLPAEVKEEIRCIMTHLRKMLRDKNNWYANEKQMYVHFGNLSLMIARMRDLNVQSGEISRVNQYISKVIIAFDTLRGIYLYRTPRSLRFFSKIFILSFPVLYAPYFASISSDYSPALRFVMPVLYSFILISLHNIQENLEHPFDQVGDDDIIINVDEEVGVLP